MTNNDVARVLQEAARKIVLQHPNLYRIRAYRRAAAAVQGLQRPVQDMSQLDLELVPGIGTHIAKCIINYTQTGKWLTFEQLVEQKLAV